MTVKHLGGVYAIDVDGIGTYYGESVDIPRRWATHRKQLVRNRHHNIKLKRAWKDLGHKAFHFRVISQSEELTLNKSLRLLLEKTLVLNDPRNLNSAISEAEVIRGDQLPDCDKYRNRPALYIERVPRSQLCRVRVETKTGMLLGIETLDGKFRSGPFRTNASCKLTRITK